MNIKRLRLPLALFFVLVLAGEALADVELPSVFGTGMVLQRDKPVPVWGWAEPGEEVTVTFAGQTHRTTAGDDGSWRVTLEPLATRKKGSTLTVRGANTVRLRDVVVGEVWVASGQSNMAWSLNRSHKPPGSWREPPPARIRLFAVPRRAWSVPLADVEAAWVGGDKAAARSRFSAVAWYFGCEIAAKLRVPVGLINTTWGGTAVLPWTPAEDADAPVREGGRKVGQGEPAALYNGMVAPLVPFAIRGAIWYQGESDASRAASYQEWFPAMIESWRDAWGQGAFPFYFVQLANYQKRHDQPTESRWAELREAQFLTHRGVENTGMAVIIDIGEANDIHPRNKHDVGFRLARWALAKDYGKDVVPSGPLYASHIVVDGKVVIAFDHVAKKLKIAGRGKLEGFAIAGQDGRFVWADAEIVGKTVVVSHPDVPEPVAVRYAWADNPACNLVNSEDLPASPFRTDEP